MPRKCCVPECKSNYASVIRIEGAKSTFSFPKDAHLSQAWLRAIPRKDWVPTKHSVVCSNHFPTHEIQTEEIVIGSDGQVFKQQLKYPRLVEGAIPRIFNNLPSYMSKSTPPPRSKPEKRRERAEQFHEEQVSKFLESDIIASFKDLVHKFQEKLGDSKWLYRVVPNKRLYFYLLNLDLYFYLLNLDIESDNGDSDGNVKVVNSVLVDENLSIQVYVKGHLMRHEDLSWILPSELKLSRWSQLENILSRYYNNSCEPTKSFDYCLDRSIKYLNEAVNIENDNFAAELVLDQMKLLKNKQRRYSVATLIFSFVIFSISSCAYNTLRQYLILPTARHLQQITSMTGLCPNSPENNYCYLKSICSMWVDREKVVNLLIDEIYIKSGLEYKSKTILGYAENNPKNLAKTVQTFMISSAFGDKKEVVKLLPVHNMSGKFLYENLLLIVNYIQSFGLKVLSIISDNNRVNQNCFKLLTDESNCSFSNPKYTDEKIFVLYDPVHIFKNIRNNWINLDNCTFTYPDLHEDNIIKRASFHHLRELYRTEKNKLCKKAFKLNNKSINPNTFERQNVMLVNNIFHDTTIAAVKSEGYVETSDFLQIIRDWWDILNVKNTVKGQVLRKQNCTPIFHTDDDKLKFLKSVCVWLRKWKSLETCVGLTRDTYEAMLHTTSGIIDISRYCFENFNFVVYILLGKFQTDNIEKRFSRYRSLSGCNYNVAYRQIVESEKKIRLQHLLKQRDLVFLKSCTSAECLQDEVNIEKFTFIINCSNYLEACEIDISSQIYVCGYVSHSLLNRFSCEHCRNVYIDENKAVNDEYFNLLQRGGLCAPTDQIMFIYYHMTAILEYIINDIDLEVSFLEFVQHKSLLHKLTLYSLQADTFYVDFTAVCTVCGKQNKEYYSIAANILANIMLNNYTKHKNDVDKVINLTRMYILLLEMQNIHIG